MSSLLESYGVDPEEARWQNFAACQNLPTELHYDDYEREPETAKAVDSLCNTCPVQKACFYAGAKGEYGVWGGVYWNGSGKPDKNKNAHKTPDIWDEIHRKVA